MFIKNARNELNKTCNINNIAAQMFRYFVTHCYSGISTQPFTHTIT